MLHVPQVGVEWGRNEVRSSPEHVVLRLIPAFDLGEASIAENLQVARVHVPTDVKVRVLGVSCGDISGGSLSTCSFHSLLSLINASEHQRVLSTSPDSETSCGAGLKHAEGFTNLIFSAVNQLQDQVGDVAVEPSVWER